MGKRQRARGLLDPILRPGPLRRPGHPECIEHALDPTTCCCNGSDVACTIALRVDCLRLLRPWTRPDDCRSYASRRSVASRRNTVTRDGRGRPVHEPHHVETRVEGALHDPLIERHDVGQQAGRHKVGDGEPGDVHVRPKHAGEQRAKDGLMALEKEMKRDDRGRNQPAELTRT